ncbi:MAG: hypothetical protein ACW99G_12235, partial [Candidatus Thorarchaeota archaeon]
EDPQMLSGFISAMGNFMGEVTGTEEVQWKTVYGADSSILVEGGDWVLGVLAVGRETTESRSKLRRIIVEFEESFSYLRDATAFEGGIYDEFDKFVRRIFVDSKISSRSLLMNPSMWLEELIQAGGQDLGGSHLSELDSITVEEIAKLVQKPLEETSYMISEIAWSKRLPISFVPPDNEILALSEGSSSILFSQKSSIQLSPSTLMVIGALDGRTKLASVMNSVSVKNRGIVLNELGSLDNSGYIQRISIERRIVLLNECILSELIESCTRELGPWKGKQYFLWAINAVIKQNPWVARLRLTKTNRVILVLDDYIGPLQLDEICGTMDKVVDLIGIYLTRDKGKATAHRIVSDAKRRCNRKWSEYLMDISL